MKKKWFYLAATLLLAGCAEDAFEDTNMQETTERQEIKLSAGTTGIDVESRGAGTVGGLENDATNNVWNGQQLIIWCFNKKTTDFNQATESNVYLNQVSATATASSGTNETNIVLDGAPHYYPLQGAFHFVGYYIDDAAGTVNKTANNITQSVTIDGSQDIMIAKAELNADNKVALVNALIEYGDLTGTAGTYVNGTTGDFVTTDATTMATIDAEYKKAFSSYTARRKVQPEMTFKHQLARLKFSVIAGDENAKGDANLVPVNSANYQKGVLIKSITLKNARTKGIITITKPDEANGIEAISFAHDLQNDTPNADGKYQGTLTLKEKANSATATDALVALTPKAPANKESDASATFTEIGESILAFPEDKYTIDIETIQYVQTTDGTNYELVNGTTGRTTSYSDVTIKLSGTNTFEAGKTYDIKVKVYSNQEISITATLEGWEYGDEITISPEDDIFDREQTPTNP